MYLNRTRIALATLAIAIVGVAAACGDGGSDATGTGVTGSGDGAAASSLSTEQTSFTAAQLGGGEFDAASLEGKDTVLWFWAPWCTVCRAEAPDVVETAARFEGTVDMIGVAGRGDVPEMDKFLSDTGTGSFGHIVDADGSIWADFGVVAQPAFAFIDDSGTVEVVSGSMDSAALSERMAALAAT